MKKKHIIISSILVVGIIFSGSAFADSQRAGHRKGFGYKKYRKGGMQMLTVYQQKNMKVEVLAEMTEKPLEAIQLKLKDEHLGSVMRELNIDRQAFRDAMQAKERAQIKQAVTDGRITPQQEEEILAKMETHAKRRELMRKLIENGIEDGIITRDEARMLIRR